MNGMLNCIEYSDQKNKNYDSECYKNIFPDEQNTAYIRFCLRNLRLKLSK